MFGLIDKYPVYPIIGIIEVKTEFVYNVLADQGTEWVFWAKRMINLNVERVLKCTWEIYCRVFSDLPCVCSGGDITLYTQ